MKTLLLSIVITIIFAGCSTTVNSGSTASARIKTHQTIAILPFEVRFDLRNSNSKKFTGKELAEVRHAMALELQQYLYNWLKNYSYKKSFTTRIQNVDITDSILTQKQISYLVLYSMPRTELAQILGVDAVLTPNVIFAQPNSEAMSLIMSSPGPLDPSNFQFYNNLATQQMRMQVLLTDRVSEKSMWTFETKTENSKFTRQVTASKQGDILYPLFENIDKTMKKFIKNFPYLKN